MPPRNRAPRRRVVGRFIGTKFVSGERHSGLCCTLACGHVVAGYPRRWKKHTRRDCPECGERRGEGKNA